MSLAEVTDLELVLGYGLEGSDVGRGQREQHAHRPSRIHQVVELTGRPDAAV